MKRSGTRGTISVWTLRGFLLSLLSIALAPIDRHWARWCARWANHLGSEGTVKIGANTIAEIRGWELNEQANTIDDSELADAAETHKLGQTNWDATVTCHWDETDTNGQMAMTIGASVTLNLYPEGATAADTYYTGTATITGIQRGGAINGIVSAVYQCKGSGALTKTTV